MTPTITTTATPTRTFSIFEDDCTDQFDNDGNGLIDCVDPACFEVAPCHRPAPVTSPPGLIMLIAVLGLTGAYGLLRMRRRRA